MIRTRIAAAASILTIASGVTACTIGDPSAERGVEPQSQSGKTSADSMQHATTDSMNIVTSTVTLSASSDVPEARDSGPSLAKLQETISSVEANYGGSAGAAVVAPGQTADRAASAGSLTNDVAWSTSKVPVAIAAVRNHGVDSNVTAAITASDNAAAEAMWASLGDPATASSAATQVLRDGGDSQTAINGQRVRPEFTAFGQTQWALANQATFGANMQCIAGGAEVVSLMHEIAADQSYGLGTIAGAAFKGGWGPDTAGAYLVRQFGVIPADTPGEYVGVAIAAKPGDGTYATGQAMLNEIAAALSAQPVKGGTCG